MHFDCRQSYCETLKQQMRVTRDQASFSRSFFEFFAEMASAFFSADEIFRETILLCNAMENKKNKGILFQC
jgi:hypothetical protein